MGKIAQTTPEHIWGLNMVCIGISHPFFPSFSNCNESLPSNLLSSLASPGIVGCAAHIPSVQGYLYPGEEAFVARAGRKRYMEFRAGRICARYALAKLGIPSRAILVRDDRTPIWPSGTIGSISHTNEYCVAMATSTARFSGLGIDIETSTPMDLELSPIICSPSELRWLQSLAPGDQGTWLKALFVAKEAIYKCQFCVTERVLDFLDISIEFSPDGRSFRADSYSARVSDIALAIVGELFLMDTVIAAKAVLAN